MKYTKSYILVEKSVILCLLNFFILLLNIMQYTNKDRDVIGYLYLF